MDDLQKLLIEVSKSKYEVQKSLLEAREMELNGLIILGCIVVFGILCLFVYILCFSK